MICVEAQGVLLVGLEQLLHYHDILHFNLSGAEFGRDVEDEDQVC